MDVKATARFVRLSPTRVRDLADLIRGRTVAEALKVTEVSRRKGGRLLSKTLKSAVANAEHNAELEVDSLRVKQATVDEGPRLRRYWARARGSVSPIRRRTCHIRIVLTDGREAAEEASAE